MPPPHKTYRLVVNGDEKEAVEVEDYLLGYFLTIKNMVQDFGENNNDVPLTLDGDTTSSTLREIVQFYRVLDSRKENARAAQLSWLSNLSEKKLASFAKVANFLEAEVFLNAVIDALKERILGMTTEELRIKAQMSVEEEGTLLWRSTRLQYRREVFIQRIMGLQVGDMDAGPLIDRRIRRFVDPLIGTKEKLIVRYHDSLNEDDDSVFVYVNENMHYLYEFFELPDSLFSWSRGIQTLYKKKWNEVVMGELFFAILDNTGQLYVFGERGGPRAQFKSKVAMKERPLGDTPCIAMWAINGFLYALTHKALILFHEEQDYVIDSGDFPVSSIVDLYPYQNGVRILTRSGLYTWSTPSVDNPHPVIAKVNVHGLGIERVWARRDTTFVVASDGRLYVNGACIKGVLGLSLRKTNTFGKWIAVDLGEELTKEIDELGGIRLIAGFDNVYTTRTILVAGNRFYTTNHATGLFEHLEKKERDLTGIGDVVSVLPISSGDILFATTTGLYFVGSLAVSNHAHFLKVLGGGDEIFSWYISFYKLKVPYNASAYLPIVANNKNARLISCTVCFAHALFAYKHTHAVCSPYCARKIDK